MGKLLKVALLASVVFLIGGCEKRERPKPAPAAEDFRPVCLDGVQYFSLYYSGGHVLAPRFNANSKVELCRGEWLSFERIENKDI